MYVQLKKNRGGSTSVLLVQSERVTNSKNPKKIIIKNFGYGKTNEEIKKLEQIAITYRNELESKSPREYKPLFINTNADIASCNTEIVGFKHVYDKIFIQVFNNLTLGNGKLEQFKNLAIMRIAKPSSKRQTALLSSHFGMDIHNEDRVYELMDCIGEPQIENIKKSVRANTLNLLQEENKTLDIYFYDLTTVYFENNTQNELKNNGFSKDGKHQHVQITLAVIVSHSGLPVDYELFPGNVYEGHTLIPAITNLQSKYPVGRVVLVADSGLINAANVDCLTSLGLEYVISAKIKNAKKTLKDIILNTQDYVQYTKDIQAKFIELSPGHRLLAIYSTKRAYKDKRDREKSIDRIKKHVGSTAKSKLTGALRKSYVNVSKDCIITLDQEKIAELAKFDGYFGLQTNIKSDNVLDILGYYRGLWQVEQTFRITKYNLKIRPVYHSLCSRIKAHFAICYAALALIRTLELRIKKAGLHLSIEELNNLLNQVKVVKIFSHGELYEIATDWPAELEPLYAQLGLQFKGRFTHSGKM